VDTSFDREMERHQIGWRHRHIDTEEWGTQNGKSREWILPMASWPEHLWRDLKKPGNTDLERYLKENKIQAHTGVNNLKSSWVLCATCISPSVRIQMD
jgi:hypothetical protein